MNRISDQISDHKKPFLFQSSIDLTTKQTFMVSVLLNTDCLFVRI